MQKDKIEIKKLEKKVNIILITLCSLILIFVLGTIYTLRVFTTQSYCEQLVQSNMRGQDWNKPVAPPEGFNVQGTIPQGLYNTVECEKTNKPFFFF